MVCGGGAPEGGALAAGSDPTPVLPLTRGVPGGIFLKWARNLSGARLGSGSDGLQGATGDKMATRLGLQSVPRLKVILS